MHFESKSQAVELLKNIILVIISPKVGWEEVNHTSIPTAKVRNNAFYPLLAMLAVACFVPMLYDKTITFAHSLMTGIVMSSSYFITYFICSYLLGGFYPELVKTQAATGRLNDYIIYNLIFLVILLIIRFVLPGMFTPIYFLMAYMPYIAFRDLEYLVLKKHKEGKFLVISSAMMLLLPQIIIWLLNMIINNH